MEFNCSSFKSYDELLGSFKHPEKSWPAYGNGAVLQFRNSKLAFSLAMTYNSGKFSLNYSRMGRASLEDEISVYSVGDPSKIGNFIEVEENDLPEGSFVEIPTAKKLVEAFYGDPTSPPNLIEWVDEDSLSWPEL